MNRSAPPPPAGQNYRAGGRGALRQQILTICCGQLTQYSQGWVTFALGIQHGAESLDTGVIFHIAFTPNAHYEVDKGTSTEVLVLPPILGRFRSKVKEL